MLSAVRSVIQVIRLTNGEKADLFRALLAIGKRWQLLSHARV
jgi:hypothetical protein